MNLEEQIDVPDAPQVPTPIPAAPPTTPGELIRPARRKSWPNVLGIGSIVIGSLGIIVGLFGVAGLVLGDQMMNFVAASGPEGETMAEVNARWFPMNLTVTILRSCTAAFLIVTGIMIAKCRPSCRPFALTYGVLQCGVAVLASFVSAMMQREMLEAMMASQNNPPPMPFFGVMSIFTFVFTLMFYAAVPCVLLVWFLRPSIRNEVQSWRDQTVRF